MCDKPIFNSDIMILRDKRKTSYNIFKLGKKDMENIGKVKLIFLHYVSCLTLTNYFPWRETLAISDREERSREKRRTK